MATKKTDTDTTVLSAETEKRITAEKYNAFVEAAKDLQVEITNQDDLDRIAALLLQVKEAANTCAAERDDLLTESRIISARYKPSVDAFKKIETTVKDRIAQADIDNQAAYEALLAAGKLAEAAAMKFDRPAFLQFRDKRTPVIKNEQALLEELITNDLMQFVTMSVDVKALAKAVEEAGGESGLENFSLENGYTIAVVAPK